jgi:hypothetical protein
LHVQCAKGSYQMGQFDTSDRFLKKALALRKGENSNLKIVGPIIKLKGEQFKTESLNLGFPEKASKLQKIIAVLESKMHEAYGGEGGAQAGEDIKTHIKCLMLKHQLESQMLTIIFDQVRAEPNIKHLEAYERNLTTYMGRSFQNLKDIIDRVKVAAQYDDYMKNTMAKTYFKHAQFTDQILRRMENESCNQVIKKSLPALKKSEEELARQTIKNGLLALNLEYSKASDIIPRMLDVVSKYKEHVEGEFIAHSKDTPAWFFLR